MRQRLTGLFLIVALWSGVASYIRFWNPPRSVLDRSTTENLSVGLVLFGLFVVSVTGLIWSICGWFGIPPATVVAEPWREREDWSRGRIAPTPTITTKAIWILAVGFNAMGWLMLGVVADEKWHLPVAVVLWFFPAVGLLLLIWSIRNLIRWRTVAGAVLELATVPAPVGGTLRGTIRFDRMVHAADGFRLRLRCYTQYVSGRNQYVVWQSEQAMPTQSVAEIPVTFNIPADAKPTGLAAKALISWRLEIEPGTPLYDPVAGFDVPVFLGTARTQEPVPAARVQLPVHSRIGVTLSANGGKEFRIGPRRSFDSVIGLTALVVGWTMITRWLWITRDIPWQIRGGFLFLDIMILLAWPSTMFGRTTIVAERDAITIANNLFRGGRTRVVPVRDIASIQTGFSFNTTQYRDVILQFHDGRKRSAATDFSDPVEADWLANEIATAAGLVK